MNSTQRIKALVEKKPVDRIAHTSWWHMPLVDKNPIDFAKATIDFTENNKFDFVKMMYNTLWFAQNFGVEIEYSQDPYEWAPKLAKQILVHPSEFKHFKPTSATEGNLGAQLEATKRVVDHFKGTVPVIGSTFTDFSLYKDLISWGNSACVRSGMKHSPAELHSALEVIHEVNLRWIEALTSIGADGMFIATHFAKNPEMTDDLFDEFCKPYDLKLVEEANKGMWFNMLHIHGDGIMPMHRFTDYDVQAVNWEDIIYAPNCTSLAEGAKLFENKVLIGGIEMWGDYCSETNDREEVKERLKQRVRDAVKQVGKDRFIFAPGCAAPVNTPPYRFSLQYEAIIEVSQELEKA